LPWRSQAGWLLGLAFGLQSVLFYAAIAWLPSIYIERGWTVGEAAALNAFFAFLGILTTLMVSPMSRWIRSRQTQLAFAATIAVVGTVGIATGADGPPGSNAVIAYASVLALNFGIGIFFPITLTLPVEVGRTPGESSSLAALMLLVGYTLSAVGPVVLGAVRDVTGNFVIAGWLVVAVAVVMLASTALLSARRLGRTAGAAAVEA
jgi:CP family cyanate transporter-like MFS transporter